MTASQIILYAIAALVFLVYVRRLIQKASMKEYSPKQVADLLVQTSIVMLDVRTNQERNQNHIKGSVHIPINDLMSKIDKLEKYRDQEIICYCHSGSRSFTAAALLLKNGFKAANMKGGIAAWNFQNLK
jgi:rhodanese-related sulfurtransferase